MSQESNKLSPEKSFWGWKLLIISIILSCIFMGIFYLAMNNEPDYMPSQKNKMMQHNEMPAMQGSEHMPHQQTASEPMPSHHTNQ
ncbi:DUF4199 domain-containing protein [Acinetobacter sp. ULE_I010]|uniref:DUF4199 domain-containing protein n=1 Tax=Acinetobacter sp. ULE_I010 TaxID=3373065 RepID=UPI003AF8829B